eukprot:s1401_g8.t2
METHVCCRHVPEAVEYRLHCSRDAPTAPFKPGQTVHWSLGEMVAMWRRAAPRCVGAGGAVGALWLYFGRSAEPDGPAGRPSRDVDAGLRYVRDEGCGRRMSHAGVRLLDGRAAMTSEKFNLAKQAFQIFPAALAEGRVASKILRGRISSSQPRGPSAMTVAADESPANLNYNYCCLPGPQRKCELVLHWKQLTSIWIVFFVIAGVSYHAPPVMLPAIMDEFHTDQYHVSWIPAVFQLMKGIFTVPGGFALDIFGCTRCLRAGSLVVLVCSALYPMAPSLWWLASLQGVYGVAYNLSGIAACIVFLTSWFEQQRALAIAILTTAFSMAGVCFPPLIGSLIQHHGWRMASCVGPVLMVFLVLPLAFLALRDGTLLRPRSQRQHFQVVRRPCDDSEEVEVGQSALREPGPRNPSSLNFLQSLWLGAVWHLAFLSLYQLYIIIALLNTLVLYLKTDVGMSVELCGLYSSVVFQASIAAKLLAGAAMDSRQALTGMVSCFVLLMGTLLLLDFAKGGRALTTNHNQLMAFAVIYGLGFGGSYSVLSAKPAKMFGKMDDFSKLQGFFMLFQVIGHSARRHRDRCCCRDLLLEPCRGPQDVLQAGVRHYSDGCLPMLQQCAPRKFTGADRVLAFHHHVRHQRAESQLGANGAEDALAGYDYRVHSDYTADSASEVLEWQLQSLSAEEAATYQQGRFLLINAWRNLSKHPVQNDHLAVCDAASVLESHLLVNSTGTSSREKRELTSENFAELVVGPTARYEVSHHHRWFYFPELRDTELLIFKCFDSDPKAAARYVLHSAVRLPGDASRARESVEVRTIALASSREVASWTVGDSFPSRESQSGPQWHRRISWHLASDVAAANAWSFDWHLTKNPWEGLTSSFFMILATELGDETFIIAAVMSMRHPKFTVLCGALGALYLMTVLSAFLGVVLPNLISQERVTQCATVLYTFFGLRLMWVGMRGEDDKDEEFEEVENTLKDSASKGQKSWLRRMFSQFCTPVFLEALMLTFLAEWGDRSQIATISLAAHQNPIAVIVGAMLGHTICTGLAVFGGEFLGKRIPQRYVAFGGGCLFIVFALLNLLGVLQ